MVRGSMALTVLHILCVAWAGGTLGFDWGCPLTPWEKSLWKRGGREPYSAGFLTRYVIRREVSTPQDNRRMHERMAMKVVGWNVLLYTLFLRS